MQKSVLWLAALLIVWDWGGLHSGSGRSPLHAPDLSGRLVAAGPEFSGTFKGTSGGPWFDVRAFGAACDGVANDTASIQAAVNAVPSTGGVVLIPPGKCKIAAAVNLKPNVELVGSGAAGQSTIRQTGDTPAVQLDNSCCRPVGPVTVRNLKIATGKGPSAHGLYFNKTFLVLVDKVFVDASDQTSSATIGGNGIRFVNVTNSSILDSTIGTANRVGVYLAGSYNVNVSNNLITENISEGIQTVKSTYLTITGNSITENNGDGVFINNGAGFFGAGQQGVVVTGNTLRANGKPLLDVAASRGDGIRFSQSAGAISGNVINYNYGHGVALRDTANVVVVGNEISANGQVKTIPRSGIELEAQRGEATTGNVIVGNRIHDDQPAKTQHYAIEESGPGTLGPNMIHGNDLRGNLQPASIAVKGSTTAVYQNLGLDRPIVRALSGTVTLTFGSIAVHSVQERSMTVPGAAVGMAPTCSPLSSIGAPFVWSSRIDSPNRVVVRVANIGDAEGSPKAVVWHCQILD